MFVLVIILLLTSSVHGQLPPGYIKASAADTQPTERKLNFPSANIQPGSYNSVRLADIAIPYGSNKKEDLGRSAQAVLDSQATANGLPPNWPVPPPVPTKREGMASDNDGSRQGESSSGNGGGGNFKMKADSDKVIATTIPPLPPGYDGDGKPLARDMSEAVKSKDIHESRPVMEAPSEIKNGKDLAIYMLKEKYGAGGGEK